MPFFEDGNHTDLLEKVRGSDLPVRTLEDLKEEAQVICGKPEKVKFGDEAVSVIKWVDGTIIDMIRKVKNE